MRAEASLDQMYQLARRAWPSVDVARDVFFRYLEDRQIDEDTASDLYLACGCALGDPVAIAAFEGVFGPEIRLALVRMKQPPSTVQEVEQLVREKLFVGEDGKRPRIAEYTGRGDLRSWLRVIAVRTAVSWLRRENKQILVQDAELPDIAAPADPELDHMRTLYATEFRAALEVAVTSLTTRERNLLRQHFIDGLGVEKLALLYRVHTATAARWLSKARDRIVQLVKTEMMRRLQLRRADVSAIMQLIRSQLDVSITRLLRDHRPSS
jgi:RNA polymerase sigma-70 factor (ECF subfamily)